ncbi:MAG: hypothetical protein JWM27_3765 [Gemmatimonadetes bacterium]|nr:hypothetical protein [Gemmatimonadota bacterium]
MIQLSRRASLRLAASVSLLAAAPARGQCVATVAGPCDEGGGRAAGQAQTVAANALLGGLTAGMMRVAHGGRFGGAFVRGAAGGALVYAGKRTVVHRFYGAGLLGRQIASVGSSVSYNAAAGTGALDRLMLPVGPVRVYVSPRGRRTVHVRVDAATLATLGYVALRRDNAFDLSATLSTGAPVFRHYATPGQVDWEGAQVAGVVQLRHAPYERTPGVVVSAAVREYVDDVAAHERVHVLQYDQSFLLWSAPAEDGILQPSRAGRALHRWVDLGLNLPLWAALNEAVGHRERPWEREAYFLSRSSPEQIGGRPDRR